MERKILNSASPFQCSQPAYNEGAPECPLISLIDFTGESGTAELVWTFQMKNGDTIYLRQTYEVVPIPVYDYHPEDYPMDTAEELQALIDTIGGQANDPVAVINLHLPPVTYEGGITIRDRSLNPQDKFLYFIKNMLFKHCDGQRPSGRRILKKILAGCSGCGNCRLQDTAFICTAKCPKKLANGPCGGVKQNGRCEISSATCIHNRIAAVHEWQGNLDKLEDIYIPASDEF